MQDTDLLTRIFPVPTEKTITDVPHIPVDQLLQQEMPFRRFRNPEEWAALLGGSITAKAMSFPGETLPSSLLAKSYVYGVGESGLSYVKLGDSQLPVRVLSLPFKAIGVMLVDEVLVVTGTKDANTAMAFIDITAPAAPRLINSFEAEGTFLAQRSAPHTVFLALRGDWSKGFHIPMLSPDGQEPSYDYNRATCNCPSLYGFSRTYTNPSFLHVVTVDVRNPSAYISQQAVALSDDQKVTLTDRALYIGYKPQLSEDSVRLEVLKNLLVPKLDGKAKVQYTQIVQAPDYVLSAGERQEKQLRYLEQQEAKLATDAKQIMDESLKQKLESELASFHQKTDVTVMHKLRFEEGRLQYVSATSTAGVPEDRLLVGETEKGTWLLSKAVSGTGVLLQTINAQMQPQGHLALEGMIEPQMRRAKGDTLWIGALGSAEASVVNLTDMTKPTLEAKRTLVADARLITVDEKRAIQVNKTQEGLLLTLLDVQGDPKALANAEIKGNAAYSRLFDTLGAAMYVPEQKMLVIHVEESRNAGSNGRFDGVMLFAVGDNTLEKKTEVDLRAGTEKTAGGDISIQRVSEKEVAVLYGKTASLLDLTVPKEVVRKTLQ